MKIVIYRNRVLCSQYMNQQSSETSVLIWTTRRYIPEDGNYHSYRCENLKSYTNCYCSVLLTVVITKNYPKNSVA
jgi:hypothetical protein